METAFWWEAEVDNYTRLLLVKTRSLDIHNFYFNNFEKGIVLLAQQ